MDFCRIQNWLFQNRTATRVRFIFLALVLSIKQFSQIANYVNNGSFEDLYNCNWPNKLSKAKSWLPIDSTSYAGDLMSACPNYALVPLNSYTYQYPKSGITYALTTFFCNTSGCMSSNIRRGYLKNRLKGNLQAGKIYCVKFFVNIAGGSSHGIDGFGAFFSDNSVDTITKSTIPLNFINPQVQNGNYNIITDTLNWTPVTSTFVANGSEKYMLIGNFKSDTNTHIQVSNSSNLPGAYTDVCIDDVSCIPLDLPAYASPGPDIWAIPGNTVYLGRQQDVGIDEACMWYKLPNTTTAIDTAAGITITVAVTTETYMVKQDICGVIKYDTVVVHASALGFVSSSEVENGFRIFPNPAGNYFELSIANNALAKNLNRIYIFNSLGQLIREENLSCDDNKTTVNTNTVPAGVYFVTLVNENGITSHCKLVVSR